MLECLRKPPEGSQSHLKSDAEGSCVQHYGDDLIITSFHKIMNLRRPDTGQQGQPNNGDDGNCGGKFTGRHRRGGLSVAP